MFWKWLKEKALKKTKELEKQKEEYINIRDLKADDKEFKKETDELKGMLKHKKRLK